MRERSGGWRFGPALRLHAALAVSVPGTLSAGWLELGRARAGNQLAWAYAVQWPLIGVFCGYLWWRLLRELDVRPVGPGRAGAEPPREAPDAVGAEADPAVADPAIADPGLVAWQRYLAELHATDPPGGPTGRGR
ncbi:MAG: hypothetical protein HY241_16495 [Actinobacteria bacterium]|nr:hypothetical protein [Actinomycetota bacterium]